MKIWNVVDIRKDLNIDINTFDLSNAEIVKPIIHKDNGTLRDVGNSVLRHKKTKIYLINEFNFNGFDMVVIIVEYWVSTESRFVRQMVVTSKNCIKRIKK